MKMRSPLRFLFPVLILLTVMMLTSCPSQVTQNNNGSPTPPTITEAYRPYLVAEYLFDSNANDTSGKGNHGVVNGADLTQDRFGSNNRAYLFSSADSDMINCSNDVSLMPTNALSVAAWFNTTNFSVNGRIVSKRGGAGDAGWEIDIYANNIRFTRHGNVINTYSTSTLTTNTWVFVVWAWDAVTGYRIYINGDLKSSNSLTFYETNDISLFIGRPGYGAINFFDGSIDNVRLYNTAIPVELVQALYTESN